MARLLVVHHSPSRHAEALTRAVLDGARDDALDGVDITVRAALEATAQDVLDADGRYDTTGAVRAVESIAGALPWRRAAPVLEVLGEVGTQEQEAGYELGATLAALISTGG